MCSPPNREIVSFVVRACERARRSCVSAWVRVPPQRWGCECEIVLLLSAFLAYGFFCVLISLCVGFKRFEWLFGESEVLPCMGFKTFVWFCWKSLCLVWVLSEFEHWAYSVYGFRVKAVKTHANNTGSHWTITKPMQTTVEPIEKQQNPCVEQ